ncbi:MAG: type I restriction enzyme HsdR N-terminal domain-containing protein [Cytophagales bacterium]|nr:MAG: type I restriction enzyme HsdR N-terminal domain-containing protein [Cytophagales bacterium]
MNLIDFSIENYIPHLKKQNDILFIKDFSRKTYLKLTPEEYVRQFFIEYLVTNKNFPISNIQTESGLKFNKKTKRADIIVYKNNVPILLVECKSMDIIINDKTIHQISNYQSVIMATYLAITNGKSTFYFKKQANDFKIIEDIPNYDLI